MNSARKRIVFDTSSLIPACLYPNREPAYLFQQALLGHMVFSSTDTFNELATVLMRNKFNAWQPAEQRLLWIRLYRDSVIYIEPALSITECRDPKDNKFLELAVAAKADMIISSDVHLLEMHPFRGIEIVPLAELRQQLNTA